MCTFFPPRWGISAHRHASLHTQARLWWLWLLNVAHSLQCSLRDLFPGQQQPSRMPISITYSGERRGVERIHSFIHWTCQQRTDSSDFTSLCPMKRILERKILISRHSDCDVINCSDQVLQVWLYLLLWAENMLLSRLKDGCNILIQDMLVKIWNARPRQPCL